MSATISPARTVPCGSWLASDSGRTFDKIVSCKSAIAGKPAPTRNCGVQVIESALTSVFPAGGICHPCPTGKPRSRRLSGRPCCPRSSRP
ncbi:hypothetical protein DM828_30775 [Pseudomonas umsongensis]|nr:hypothetical protein [Pseudomonas umsongensis]